MTTARWGTVLAAVVVVAGALVPRAAAGADAATGFAVAGTQLLLDGRPFVPRGFNLVGVLTPDWCVRTQTVDARVHLGPPELAAAQAWGATTLRFQVSQRGLADPAIAAADRDAYLQKVVAGVTLARTSGFAVILSMQDQSYGCGPAHPLPTAQTVAAWDVLAPAFRADPSVAFELFNEPVNDTTAAGWAQWRDGGTTPLANQGDPAVGHQELVEHLRAQGVPNLLLADVAQRGERSQGIPLLADPAGDLAYAIHPYGYTAGPTWWDQQYGSLAAVAPVVATEWNYLSSGCGTAKEKLAPDLLAYLRAHGIGLLGHAFDQVGTIVADWTWTPTQCDTASGGSGAVLRADFAVRAGGGPPPDTTPPSTPASLTARLGSPGQVALGWPASTDDVGVDHYLLSRDGVAVGTLTGRTATDSPPPGAHLYSVLAVDAAGNTSGAATATAVVPSPAPAGLTGTYFDTATFTTQKLVRVDPTVNFAWGTGSPAKGIGADTFSVRWTGRLLPTADGSWTFYTDSDQGARLWIDGALVVDDFTAHTLREKQATIALTANRAHDLRVDYYDSTGAATMKLLWSGPGTGKQVVPSARLLAR